MQDFNPQIAFDNNGQAVAVWSRNKNVQSASTELDVNYTNAFEIAYAVWNGSSWSAPTLLTTNNLFDHAPILARGSDGKILLVWTQNAAGELLGAPDAPDTIMYSVWNGTQWSSSQPLITNVFDITGITAARFDNNKMAIAYSRDLDGDFSTSLDQELFVHTWNGTNWSLPTQITADGLVDDQPAIFYSATGQTQLLWLKDDILHTLLDGLTGNAQVVTLDEDVLLLDYSAAQDSSGNMVVLWQGYSTEGVDVYYTAYDQANHSFSSNLQLTHDQPLEKFMAPVIMDSGELLMAYSKVALRNETVELQDGTKIEGVTLFGANDLYVLQHSFGADLVLGAEDITLSPANPSANSPVQINVRMRNVGDQAVVNPQISLYNGNPASGGSLIATQSAALTLAGGTETSLSFNWTLPASAASVTLYAVADPNHQVTELSENNNQATLQLGLPDLVVATLKVEYGTNLIITTTAVISNVGVIAAQPAQLAFKLDDPITGTIVASTSSPLIAPGTTATVNTSWVANTVPPGSYRLYAVADDDNQISEASENNNDEWTGLHLLPDLALRSTAVLTGFAEDGTINVSVWVFNTGTQDVQAVQVGAYKYLSQLDGTAITSSLVDVPADEYQGLDKTFGKATAG